MISIFEPAFPISAIAPHRLVPLTAPRAVERARVHVLRVDFAFGVPLDAPSYAALDATERARAARFVHADDAARSAATRAALREVLGAVLQVPAASLRFVADKAGRPALAPGCAPGAERIDFNVSHSGRHALIAWSAATRVGVDIEAARADLDWVSLGRSVFAPADAAGVHAFAPDERLGAFYRVWTAKEALLKALGVGIAGGLTAFSVLDSCVLDRPTLRIVDASALASGVDAYAAAWLDGVPGHPACVAWRTEAGAPGD